MAQCKVCDKKYHACGSCGLANWEYDYCGFKCYQEGTQDIRKEIDEFIQSLSRGQRKQLFNFVENWEELFWMKLEEKVDE